MKNRLTKLLILALALISFTPLYAQISEGGLPPSFNLTGTKMSMPVYEAVVDFDINRLLIEDEELEDSGLSPRCGKVIPTNLNLMDYAVSYDLPNGKTIWQLEITAADALAILLYYDKFIIPEGGKLFIYNPERTSVLGAYTSKTNTKGKEFATEFVYGDRLILEYVSPKDLALPEIVISGVGYGYNHLNVPDKDGLMKYRGNSGACMINVNCSEGDDWQIEKKGIARILTYMPNGSISLCSGTLINNTAYDQDPLFLSAYHCYMSMDEALMNQSIYYFHYEDPGCDRLNKDQKSKTIVGAQYLVELPIKGHSDGALVRLNSPVPEDYDVYYNGWDRRDIPAQEGVGIHHPAGDVKKISTYSAPAVSAKWDGQYGPGAIAAHWNIMFVETENGHSVIEGGSSGSPLFNQNKLVVGTLTGGNASCRNLKGDNFYGKLWYHWDQGEEKMDQYLDPLGLGVETLQGIPGTFKLPLADFAVEENLYVSRSVQFIDQSTNPSTWSWTFEGATPATSEEQSPQVVYAKPGTYKVMLMIDKDTQFESTKEMTVEIVYKENMCPENQTIGEGTSKSVFPLGAGLSQTMSSSIYLKSELNIEKNNQINQLSWHAGAASDTHRIVRVYLKETEDETFTETAWADELKDAELLCETTDEWSNEAGWLTLDFSRPFNYKGGNLKVIVQTITTQQDGVADPVSSDCYYSTSTNRHLQWVAENSSQQPTTGTISNNRPNIRFHYSYPCGADAPVADFTMNGLEDDVIEIYTDDVVRFTDKSTGPVVNWHWDLKGATIEESTVENPEIRYSTKGTYSVKLKVDNHLGNATKEKTIKVLSKKPEVGLISSSRGFITYPDNGQSFPYTGGEVSFTDQSKYYPEQWEWSTPGASVESSADKNFSTVYRPGEAVYSVSLKVTNEGGSDQVTKTDYVKVGGVAPVWNMPQNDPGTSLHVVMPGEMLTGTNSDYNVISQRFENQYKGTINKVDVMIREVEGNALGNTYYLFIYSDKNGMPDQRLTNAISFTIDPNSTTGYTTINLIAPVSVTKTYHVAISRISSGDGLVAIASSEKLDNYESGVCVNAAGGWSLLQNFYEDEEWPIALNIVSYFTHDVTDYLTALIPTGLRAAYDTNTGKLGLAWEHSVGFVDPFNRISYNIYRDETLIASGVEKTYFEDEEVTLETEACYAVSVSYDNGDNLESELSTPYCITPSSIGTIASSTIKVYPNPATAYFTIESQEDIEGLSVSDVQGRTIYSKEGLQSTKETISVDAWAKGIYLIQVQTAYGNKVYKLIVQ